MFENGYALLWIGFYANAFYEIAAKGQQRKGVALVSGQFEKGIGLLQVFFNTLALRGHNAQLMVCPHIACIGSLLDQNTGSFDIACNQLRAAQQIDVTNIFRLFIDRSLAGHQGLRYVDFVKLNAFADALHIQWFRREQIALMQALPDFDLNGQRRTIGSDGGSFNDYGWNEKCCAVCVPEHLHFG